MRGEENVKKNLELLLHGRKQSGAPAVDVGGCRVAVHVGWIALQGGGVRTQV